MSINANNRMVIFIYHSIKFGGIGTYIYEQIKNLIEIGTSVCWLKNGKANIEHQHKNVLSTEKIAIFNDKLDYKVINRLVKERHIDEVKIISFAPLQFVIGEEAKRKIKGARVDNFYFVPHFVGGSYYLEEFFIGNKHKKVKAEMSKIFEKMNNNGNLRYFSKTHVDTIKEKYGLTVEYTNKTAVPLVPSERVFDEDRVRSVYNQEKFNILTVSRLEFPHKGFVLGLVKTFFNLKKKYPNIILTIVGDGPDRKLIEQEIEKNNEFATSVKMVGSVAPEDLYKFYDKANINISVAGCYSRGVSRGVLSCPARHYCFDCEVYGLSSELKTFLIEDKPGESVELYIERVLGMTEDEYLMHSYESFNSFTKYYNERNNADVGFDIKNVNSLPTLSKGEIWYIRKQCRSYFSKYLCEAKKEGLLKPITKRIFGQKGK